MKHKDKAEWKIRESKGCGTVSISLTNTSLESQKEKRDWDRSFEDIMTENSPKKGMIPTIDPRSSNNLSK